MTREMPELGPEVAHDHVAAWLNLSHELRTPANAILGHLELVLSGSAGPLSSELRYSLGEIQQAALTLSAQIRLAIKLAEDIPTPAKANPGPFLHRGP